MLGHTGTLWHYLGSFVGYTLFAIGLIYGAYWFLRKTPNNWFAQTAFQKKPDSKKAALLEVEANLALEPRKNLYIVRAGQDRFLISATMEQTQCLAKLTAESDVSSLPVELDELKQEKAAAKPETIELPWFAREDAQDTAERGHAGKPGLRTRLAQSVLWLLDTRRS
jgi:flagellar biogenesis protein FliO